MAIVSMIYGCASVVAGASRLCNKPQSGDAWNDKPCIGGSYKVLTW